jgi:hypothetical protein
MMIELLYVWVVFVGIFAAGFVRFELPLPEPPLPEEDEDGAGD